MPRTPGNGVEDGHRTFPFSLRRFKHGSSPPLLPRCPFHLPARAPHRERAPRGTEAGGAVPVCRRLHLLAPASAGRRNSSAFLPCASSLFLALPVAAASFPTSTLPKLFSRSPEPGALPQLPAVGSRLLLNFWGSRMSKMEKEIL